MPADECEVSGSRRAKDDSGVQGTQTGRVGRNLRIREN